MPSIALNKEMNIEVKLRLIKKGNDAPLTGNEISVRLYDKDVFNDDFLGESKPDSDGVATFLFSPGDFSKPANLDNRPDFYFAVYKSGNEIFNSKVMSDVVISDYDQVVMKEGKVIDLGTFLVDAG